MTLEPEFPAVLTARGRVPARVSDVETRATVDRLLPSAGAVLLRGFGVDTPEKFEQAVRLLSGRPLSYSEQSSPRTQLRGNVYSSTEYPREQEIFLHNENSYQFAWPRRLHFACFRAPETGGATPLADTRKVCRRIDPDLVEEFSSRGWQVVRNFQEGLGVRWQDAFGTTSRDVVDQYCAENQIRAEWLSDEHLRTRAVRRAVHRHPSDGVPTWFNHIAFFHVSTLPADIGEGLRLIYAEEDLPTNTYFGDGATIPDDALDHLRQCYRSESTRFDWERGDLLIIDNMNVAHGREPFSGPRSIGVAMTQLHQMGATVPTAD